MSITQRAFKQGSWLAFFKFITQVFSWATTIIVARLLIPEDYGLMDMATVLTGYAALLGELGLGAAVIQRPNTTQENLSSVFWFTFIIGFFFVGVCFLFAYPTAWVFDEPRVIPLTQSVSVIFILNALAIVPLNLLKKKLNFKKVGFIEMTAALISCAGMLVIAYAGGGVWTLLLGHIIRSLARLLLVFYVQQWSPKFYFNFKEVKSYLKFGIVVALGRTFRYLFEKSDRFFAGITWAAGTLGLYSFAIILAKIPTEKILSLIMQVSYSAFAELQNDRAGFNNFYLNINKIIAMIVLPLFVGGFLAGEELIKVFLDDKWTPIIFLFKMLCLSQIFVALTAVNNHVHNAQGRPGWSMRYNGICAIIMAVCFYFAVQYGLNAIVIPWLTVFPFLCVAFIAVTLLKIKVGVKAYLKTLSLPVSATAFMAAAVLSTEEALLFYPGVLTSNLTMLVAKIGIGGLSYIGFLVVFDREFMHKSYRLLVTG